MKRTINFKAVAILAVIAVSLCVAEYFVHGYQMKRHSRELLEQATRTQRDGHPDETARLLEQYLGIVPNDIDAQARYALVLRGLAKGRQQELRAFLVLEAVLRRDGKRDDVRRAAAELALKFARFREAGEYVETLQKTTPNDADLALLRGRCELGMGNIEPAINELLRATQVDPQRVEVAVEVAGLLRGKQLDRPARADEVIERLIVGGRPAHEAHAAAARYFSQYGPLDKATQQLQLALTNDATSTTELLLLAAEVAQRRGQRAETRQYLEHGLRLYPKDARIVRSLAQIDLQEGRRTEANALMATAAQTVSDQPEEMYATAETFIELGQLDQAKVLIARLEAARAVAPAHLLSGRVAMKNASWGDARAQFEKARGVGVPPTLEKFLYVWLAECYGRLGFVDQELMAFRLACKIDRTWVPARRGLASAMAATGQLGQAIEEYRNLLTDGTDVRTELARLLLIHTQRLPAKERNYDEIDQLLHRSPGTDQPAPVLLQAEVLVAKGKPQDAQKLIEAERDRDPTQVGNWLALASLAQQSGVANADLNVLTEAEQRVGPRIEWELARAWHWFRASQTDVLAQLNQLASSVERFPKAEAVRLLAGLAEIHQLRSDAAAAQRLWVKIAELAPDNLAARFELFELAIQTGANGDADRYLEEIRRIEGADGPLTAYGEAARIVARAVRGDAATLIATSGPLAKAAEISPTWSRVLSLQAQAFELNGRLDQAVEKYREAIERGDNRLGVIGRALQLLYQQHRYAEANALAAKLSKQSLTETKLGRVVAEIWAISPTEKGTDPNVARERALDLARQSVKADSRDHRDFLWLAQMAVIANQPAEAEKALRHAVRLEPTAPDAWVMLVSFLAKTDSKRVDAELDIAHRTLARDQVAAILAPCLEALGRSKEADEQYKAALVARPNDVNVLRGAANFLSQTGQAGQAILLLRKLIDPGLRVPEETRTWARRNLALTIAMAGDYQQYREALVLLDANGPSAPQDRLAKAIILAVQPANRRDAIIMFEKLAAQQDAMPADARFIMAQLYEIDGDWRKARLYMLTLVNEFDKNPTYLARYIRSLLRHDGAAEASEWVGKLSVLSPDSYETAELKARVLKARGRPANEAAEPIRTYAHSKGARLELAAAFLDEDEFAATAEAETLYRQFVAASSQPDAALALTGFLARHKRLPEALAICDRAWATCPAETVAAACVSALRVGAGNAAQCQQVERWLEAAMAKNPQSTMLPTLMGMMYESNDRTAEAVARYRQVLKQDPRNVVALNNLACLLAQVEKASAESLALINQAIELAGPDAELLDSRALIYLRAGQTTPALRDIQQAIVQMPVPSKTLSFHLAQVHFADNNRVGAAEALTKAKAIGLQATDLVATERAEFEKLVTELKLD